MDLPACLAAAGPAASDLVHHFHPSHPPTYLHACHCRSQVKALIEAGLFRHIRVFSGASGGSILASLIACKTEKELLKEVLVDTFTTDFTVREWQARRPYPSAETIIYSV